MRCRTYVVVKQKSTKPKRKKSKKTKKAKEKTKAKTKVNLTRSSDPQDSADATVASLPPTLPAKAPAKPSLQRSLSISYDVDILGSCGLAGAVVVCDSSNIPFDCELTQVTWHAMRVLLCWSSRWCCAVIVVVVFQNNADVSFGMCRFALSLTWTR